MGTAIEIPDSNIGRLKSTRCSRSAVMLIAPIAASASPRSTASSCSPTVSTTTKSISRSARRPMLRARSTLNPCSSPSLSMTNGSSTRTANLVDESACCAAELEGPAPRKATVATRATSQRNTAGRYHPAGRTSVVAPGSPRSVASVPESGTQAARFGVLRGCHGVPKAIGPRVRWRGSVVVSSRLWRGRLVLRLQSDLGSIPRSASSPRFRPGAGGLITGLGETRGHVHAPPRIPMPVSTRTFIARRSIAAEEGATP